VHQQAFQNVVVFAQMRASHAAGSITVGEGPFDQLAPLPQKPLALRPLQPLPVPIDHLLLGRSNTLIKGATGDPSLTVLQRAPGFKGEILRDYPNNLNSITIRDNFSTKGNVNPYTGKKGTKTPKK